LNSNIFHARASQRSHAEGRSFGHLWWIFFGDLLPAKLKRSDKLRS